MDHRLGANIEPALRGAAFDGEVLRRKIVGAEVGLSTNKVVPGLAEFLPVFGFRIRAKTKRGRPVQAFAPDNLSSGLLRFLILILLK